MTPADISAELDKIIARHLANEWQRAGIVAEIMQVIVAVLEDKKTCEPIGERT